MILVVSWLRHTLITRKVYPPVQSLPKCFGIPMSLQKMVFLLGKHGGQGLYIISVKEKGFSFSKKVHLLWEEGRRVEAYSDPLSINLGTMD